MSNKVWEDNSIQFPRLLAEIYAVGLTKTQYDELSESMGASKDEIKALFERAEAIFESYKKEIATNNAFVSNNYIMSYDEFWTLVDEFNWPNSSSLNPNEIKAKIMRKYPNYVMVAFRDKYSDCHRALSRKIDKFIKGVGDDGFDDLVAHIIGLGKTEFEKTMKRPELAQKRVNTNAFVESFAYCIPYADDYKRLNLESYIDKAAFYAQEYTAITTPDAAVNISIEYLVMVLKKFVETKDMSLLYSNEAELNKHASVVHQCSYCSSNKFPTKWAIQNLISDLRVYLGNGGKNG